MARTGEPDLDRRTVLKGALGAGLGTTLVGTATADPAEDCFGLDPGMWDRKCNFHPADNGRSTVTSVFDTHAPKGEEWAHWHAVLNQETGDVVVDDGEPLEISTEAHCLSTRIDVGVGGIDTDKEDIIFRYELAESSADLDAGNTFFEATCDPLECGLGVTGDADPRASGGPPRCEWTFALDCGGNCTAVSPSVTVSFDGTPPVDSFTLNCDNPAETVTLLPNKEYAVTYSGVTNVDTSSAPTRIACGNPGRGKGNGKP